jgi:hypothetical protein
MNGDGRFLPLARPEIPRDFGKQESGTSPPAWFRAGRTDQTHIDQIFRNAPDSQ